MAKVKIPAGQRSKLVKAIRELIDLSDGKLKGFKAIGRNGLDAGGAPIFKVGKTKNLVGKSDEYIRQLQRQMDGLNNMSARELLDNMDNVTRGGLAQREARERFRKDLFAKELRAARRQGLSLEDAMDAANKSTDSKMSLLAALHEPDIIAGGRDVIGIDNGLPSMGDKYVNSSIGSQWKNMQDELRAYAEQLVKSGNGDQKLNLTFLLK